MPTIIPDLCGAGDHGQGSVPSGQVLYHLSYICVPKLLLIVTFVYGRSDFFFLLFIRSYYIAQASLELNYVPQAGLELTDKSLASASQVLRFQVWDRHTYTHTLACVRARFSPAACNFRPVKLKVCL